MNIKLLKREILILIVGITLLTFGLFGVTNKPVYKEYTDEEIKMMAEELGMIELKDSFEKESD